MSGWTPADIGDLSGRTAVVTGANSGIGLQAASQLAAHGARVILACRDTQKGGRAAGALSGTTEVRALDLADLGSVRAFAETVDGPLDLLVNNAGVMALPKRKTKDGFEMQLGTNHLGHFALTGLLLPRLLEAAKPRVVTVSSGAHKIGRMNFDDLQSERSYQRWKAYGQSKLANLLFTFELQRRADFAKADLTSVAAHPGYAATNLQTAGPKMDGSALKERLNLLANKVLAQSDAQGAWPTLYAATTEDLAGGSYVGPDGFLEMRGHPHLVSATSHATDEQSAARLWTVSEELTGVTFDFTAAVPA